MVGRQTSGVAMVQGVIGNQDVIGNGDVIDEGVIDEGVVSNDGSRARPGPLTGRTALVTGATSGIGRAVVLRLAAAGAQVVATGRDAAALTELDAAARAAGSVPGQVTGHPADLTDPGHLERLVTAVRTRTGRLDLLVHSAGAFHRAELAGAPLADLDRSYQVNLRAPYALTQALLADLEAAGRDAGRDAVGDVPRRDAVGDVVFVNSSQGLTAGAGTSQYAATKHGLRAVADSLRAELSGSAIRICTIYPGRTATPMQERVAALEGQPYDPTHLMRPEDVADLVVAVVSLPGRTEVPEVVMRPTIRR